MLDLHTRVRLQEEEPAVLQQPLDRAGTRVVHGGGRIGTDLADPLTQTRNGFDSRGGGLLDQLLMTTLQRAITLTQMDHVAVLIGQDLHLNMPGIGQIPLQIHGRVGEELLPLPRRTLKRLLKLVLAQSNTEALTTTTTGGLDRHRITDLRIDNPPRILNALHRRGCARHDRHHRPPPSTHVPESSSPSPRSRSQTGR
jgi:hypothetical protein